MEPLAKELEKLGNRATLAGTVEDIENVIDQLKEVRSAVESNPTQAPAVLSKAQQPATKSFDSAYAKLKDIHGGLNKYQKVVKEKFKETPLPFAEENAVSSQVSMINRAIAMHLLREGLFDVASTFIAEANAHGPAPVQPTDKTNAMDLDQPNDAANTHQEGRISHDSSWINDFSPSAFKASPLQEQFGEMYSILRELRENRNLLPAINWAHLHSEVLDARGSNLEFELCRLQYIALFTSDRPGEGRDAALTYARNAFPHFNSRYQTQIRQLLGAVPYAANLERSPYAQIFSAASEFNTAAAAAAAFTSEFCALLSLSSASPLLTAITAGCIALPTLQKYDQIKSKHQTSWTTTAELPVEVTLPPAYSFHSVFVCPVSKEQATDHNPPMMLPCGHVIAKESLDSMSKGQKFKCPYCPQESHPNEAMRIYL
ncbi:MAG: hypothetical protein Q9159_004193 [Coniocarpon cinnabarinum]